MTWLQYPHLPVGQLQTALDTIEGARFILLRSFFMLSLHKPFTLNTFLVFVMHIEYVVRNLSIMGNP